MFFCKIYRRLSVLYPIEGISRFLIEIVTCSFGVYQAASFPVVDGGWLFLILRMHRG